MQSGVPTVERLGSMTPEELLAIEGVDQEGLEKIGMAVNGYYSQYDQAEQEVEPSTETVEPQIETAVPVVAETAVPVEPSEEISPGEGTRDAGPATADGSDPVAEATIKVVESVPEAEDESATIKSVETEPIS